MEYDPKGYHTLATATTLVQMCKQINSLLEAGEETAESINLGCHAFFIEVKEKMEIIEKSPAVVQAHAFLDGYHARGVDDLSVCDSDEETLTGGE